VKATLARVIAAATVGWLAGAAASAVVYVIRPTLTVEMLEDRAPAWPAVRGVYPAGHEGNVTYAWSMGQFDLRLPNLDRRVPWRLVVRVKAGRPEPMPTIEVVVDGLRTAVYQSPPDFAEIVVPIPSRAGRRGLTAFMFVTPTLATGGSDPRQLGVMIDRVSLEPASSAWPLVPIPTLVSVGATGAIFCAAGALIGLSVGMVTAMVIPIVALASVVVAHGVGPFMPYASRVVPLAAWSLGVVAMAAVTTTLLGRRTPDQVTRAAWFVTAGLLFLKAAVLLHPDVEIGDIGFHVHRFEMVQGGDLFFLSVGPGGEFPYPIALYVAALPFVEAFGNPDIVLRLLALAAGALAGLALFGLVRRVQGSGIAALVTLLLVGVIPIDFQVHGRAFLTNAFGNAAAVLTLAVVAGPWFGGLRSWGALAAIAAFVVAMTSHVSTAVILAATLAVVAAFYRRSALIADREAGRALAAVVAAGLALSVVLYYGWFGDFYRSRAEQWQRPAVSVSSESAGPAVPVQRDEAHQTRWVAGWIPLKNRVFAVPRYSIKYFGWPAIALAFVGLLTWRRPFDRLSRAMLGWIATCAVFLVLGLLTPIDLRYYLAVYPALAMLGAQAVEWGWRRGPLTGAAAVLVIGWAGVSAAKYWVSWLG
jgi:hypothetical protein